MLKDYVYGPEIENSDFQDTAELGSTVYLGSSGPFAFLRYGLCSMRAGDICDECKGTIILGDMKKRNRMEGCYRHRSNHYPPRLMLYARVINPWLKEEDWEI